MPWGRIDDSLYDHPKLDALGRHRLPAIGLHALALSWCNRWLTDGHVPAERVRKLGGTRALAEVLVTAGLWEPSESGYRIHDFLDYNESAAYVRASRDQKREAGRLGGLRSGEARRGPSTSEAAAQPPAKQALERLVELPSERLVELPSRPVPARPGPAVRTPPAPARKGQGQNGVQAPITTVIDFLEATTGRPYSFGSGSKVHEALSADVRDFGAEPVLAAMALDEAEHPDIGQLVFGASRRLHPISAPAKPAEPDSEWVAQQLAARRKARQPHA